MKKYSFDFEIRKNGSYMCYRRVIAEGDNMRGALRNARQIVLEYINEQWPGAWARLNAKMGKTNGVIGIQY